MLRSLRGSAQDFHDLMRYRIMDVLLVASPYDTYILEEAGQLAERLLGEFRNLDLHYGPGLTGVSTGAEALALARQAGRFGLLISALHLGDMTGAELARRVKQAGLAIPVILLAFDNRELQEFLARSELTGVERVFLWQGDARILLAIVKSVEDWRNVEHDTRVCGVQVIILIEDNVRYYSSFLPAVYAELLHHSQRLIAEGVNLSHKITRMRARPKILLCGTYEEAWDAFTAYADDILGVVSDVEFPKGGRWSADAGLTFVRRVRERWPDVPALLQSSRPENEPLAREAGAGFLLKGSTTLIGELRSFMLDSFGFGDFVFRLPDGREVDRASDLRALEEKLASVPEASIAYHAERNHFSKWLKARTEFALAHELRPRKLEDFPSLEALRRSLIESIEAYRRDRGFTTVADFDRGSFDASEGFYRVGGGSLGGKARGLAFMQRLLGESRVGQEFPGIELAVPPCVVIGTDVFDAFLERNDLGELSLRSEDDAQLLARFLAARLPAEAEADLACFLERVREPLAVRSSSLLEDSPYRPFSGVYETFMLPNDHPFVEVRFRELVSAIKRVYASTFSSQAKAYIRATPYRLEEEKMAVILQRLVGVRHDARFYPDFAGVARSHDVYARPPHAPGDGIAAVGLGLGRTVVEGGACLRFCPRYPRHAPGLVSLEEALRGAQRRFWALELDGGEGRLRESEFGLEEARADGTLALVASTYSAANEALYDGLGREGVPVVTFAPVLKQGLFPLGEVLARLLELAAWGMGAPVEIEFAVNLSVPAGRSKAFAFLQLRPLALAAEPAELELGGAGEAELICRSDTVLGAGKLELSDALVVDHHRFDRARSRDVALELARLNAELAAAGTPYLLVGVGRWGSADPWLGIPVAWEQISGARVIVEAGFRDLVVEPSQGTHFFQNLTSFDVGYFTVNPERGDGFVDWDWLSAQPAEHETAFVRHLRFPRPAVVKMNGRAHAGVILKP
jgi:CheY-like chemotaxis protein